VSIRTESFVSFFFFFGSHLLLLWDRTKTANAAAIKKSSEQSQALIQKLRKILIERKKEDVLKDQLPTKSEQVVFCEPSPLQKRVYQHILSLPDFVLIQNAHNPCDCSINAGFFQRYQRLASAAERINYYRKNKDEIVKQKDCCYRIPLNPHRDEVGQPHIDPDAAIWRMLDKHEDDEGCERCPLCCFFPAAQKL
jgi:SNF2 family DNA or RNA helicase